MKKKQMKVPSRRVSVWNRSPVRGVQPVRDGPSEPPGPPRAQPLRPDEVRILRRTMLWGGTAFLLFGAFAVTAYLFLREEPAIPVAEPFSPQKHALALNNSQGPEAALLFLEKRIRTRKADDMEKLMYVDLAQSRGMFSEAAAVMKSMAGVPPNVEYRLVVFKQALGMNQLGEAARVSGELLAARPDSISDPLRKPLFAMLAQRLTMAKAWPLFLEAFPVESVVRTPAMVNAHLEALRATGNYSGVEDFLRRGDVSFNPVSRKLFLSDAAAMKGDDEAALSYWRDGFSYALTGETLRVLSACIEQARRMGHPELPSITFLEQSAALGFDPFSRDVLFVMFAEFLSAHRTRDAYDLALVMSARFPRDEVLANNLDYLKLILNIDRADILNGIVERYGRRGVPWNMKSTAVLALLLQGKEVKALELASGAENAIFELTPGSRAIFAASFRMVGDAERARVLSENLKMQDLLPEERQLLESLGPGGPH